MFDPEDEPAHPIWLVVTFLVIVALWVVIFWGLVTWL